MIRWFTQNGIAANFLMLAILIGGAYTLFFQIPLEVSPERDFQSVIVQMKYRGGTAKDLERAILIPIEEVLESIDGIKTLNARGWRGSAGGPGVFAWCSGASAVCYVGRWRSVMRSTMVSLLPLSISMA